MPLDYTNPHVLKFLSENFEKAEEMRMIWFMKNKAKLQDAATFRENSKDLDTGEVLRAPIEICMPFMALHHESSMGNRRRKALRDGIVRCDTRFESTSRRKGRFTSNISVPEYTMKPVDLDVQNILYRDLPNGGRRVYLDKRKRVLPEDKYNFCETSTNVYGWRLNDSELSRQPPKYGRYFTFKHDINSRSGPQPDPAYYQKPPDEPYSKCFG